MRDVSVRVINSREMRGKRKGSTTRRGDGEKIGERGPGVRVGQYPEDNPNSIECE